MALSDKVEDLQTSVAALIEREASLRKAVEGLEAARADAVRQLADLRRETEREVALLKREIDDVKKWKDDHKKQQEEWSRRIWSFGPNVLAAVVSVVLAAVVSYLVSRLH
jgi:hypothetical protein